MNSQLVSDIGFTPFECRMHPRQSLTVLIHAAMPAREWLNPFFRDSSHHSFPSIVAGVQGTLLLRF